MKQQADQYFDLLALSKYSCMSKDTLRDHIRCLALPAFKIKGKILVRKSEFDRWVEKHRIKGVDIDSIVKKVVR